jgi:myo-inositol-1(or 4)-monophosphatase
MNKFEINIDDCIAVGMEVARESGRLLMERFNTDFAVTHKGVVNLVTEVDLAAEEMIVAGIRNAFPSHVILAEEKHGDSADGKVKWVIDPLDGTTNYAHSYPFFSVSIGLEITGEMEWGVVFDPLRNELFTARRGAGAFCNGGALRVSEVRSLSAALLATGFPYDIRTSGQNNLNHFGAFAVRAQGIRRSGSAALDLCHVASGCLDGYWELKLKPWDCAAGFLIVREAGGTVTNFRGRPGSIYEGDVIASNGLIHQEMIAVLETANLKS